MEGKLFKIRFERYIKDIWGSCKKYGFDICYDQETKIAIDLDTFDFLDFPSIETLENYLNGKRSSNLELWPSPLSESGYARQKFWDSIKTDPVISFKAEELTGGEYLTLKESITGLQKAKKNLAGKLEEIKEKCLKLGLTK